MDERRDIEDTVMDDLDGYGRDPFEDEVAEVAWDFATDPDQIVPW